MDRVRLKRRSALAAAVAAGALAAASWGPAPAAADGASAAPAAGAAASPLPAKLVAALPATWTALADAAAAVQGSVGKVGLTLVHAAAWGDPARRCYAVYVQATVTSKLAEVEAGLRAALAFSPAPPAAAPAPAAPAAGGSAAAASLRVALPPPSTGTLVAHLRAEGRLTLVRALACEIGARYPEACRKICERLADALEAP
ncbi:MAG: hypothetical protein IPI49_16080 [Myxococcales bacterium]|nr:hypothetical protein [Myxococcales bacterium]